MAIARHPISQGVVKGYRGKIDFYFQRGRQVIRRWPKKSNLIPTPAQKPMRDAFALICACQRAQGPQQRAAWRAWNPPRGQTWVDYVHRVWLPPALDGTLFCVPDFSLIQWRDTIGVPGRSLYLSWDPSPVVPDSGFRIVLSRAPSDRPRWPWQILDHKIQRGKFQQPRWEPKIPNPVFISPAIFSAATGEARFDARYRWNEVCFAVIPTNPDQSDSLLSACVRVPLWHG